MVQTLETLQELEDTLIMSDLGIEVAQELVEKLRRNKFDSEVSYEDVKDNKFWEPRCSNGRKYMVHNLEVI